MEAMAAGCPVAISRDVNLAEEVADANAGLIADAEPRAFAAGLLELLGDPEEAPEAEPGPAGSSPHATTGAR